MQPDRLTELEQLEADTAKFLKNIRIAIAYEKAARRRERSQRGRLRALGLIPIGATALAYRHPKGTSAFGGGITGAGVVAAAVTLIPLNGDSYCPPGGNAPLAVPTRTAPATPSATPGTTSSTRPTAPPASAPAAPPAARLTATSPPPASTSLALVSTSIRRTVRPTSVLPVRPPTATSTRTTTAPSYGPRRRCIRVVVRVDRGRLEVRVWCWRPRQ